MAWLMNSYSLVPAKETPNLCNLEHVVSGLAFSTNQGFELNNASRPLVVGGPCLGYCKAEHELLGLEIIADIITPLAMAHWSQTECLLYVSIFEEALLTPDSIPLDDWVRIGDTIECFIMRLAQAMEVEKVHIFRTDVPTIDKVVDAATHMYLDQLQPHLIEDLYAINSSGSMSHRDDTRLAQYRRNVVSYLPAVLRAAIGLKSSHILAAENIHQVKAINKARELLGVKLPRSAFNFSNSPDDRIDHIVYLAPPSITGSRRMAFANPRSTIYILEDTGIIEGKLRRMSNASRHYWSYIWPEALILNLLGRRSTSLLDIIGKMQELLLETIAHTNSG